ncbi:MAG: aldo/keto reductase [Myxococcota bacterium]
MHYTFLGNTGLKVSELCLGAMTFGAQEWGADAPTSRRIFDRFADAGGNFIDTANAYAGGESERLLGQFVRGRRDRFVIATKYTLGTDSANANAFGNGRKNFMRSLEASLRRLDTDYIDLFYAHMWDGFTPIDETLRAMEDAISQGKVVHFGLSDFPAWLFARADALAEVARSTRPAALQIEYNLAQREAERELLPMAQALGVSVLDWSPLAGGVLTGKTLKGDGHGRVATGAVGHFKKYKTERTEGLVRELLPVAQELGCTPAQLSIAWVQSRSPLHIPIIGAKTLEQLEDNLGALNLTLNRATRDTLDELSRVELGFPRDFLATGWPVWFDRWPERFDRRIRPDGREALRLDDANWERRTRS